MVEAKSHLHGIIFFLNKIEIRIIAFFNIKEWGNDTWWQLTCTHISKTNIYCVSLSNLWSEYLNIEQMIQVFKPKIGHLVATICVHKLLQVFHIWELSWCKDSMHTWSHWFKNKKQIFKVKYTVAKMERHF